MKKFNILLTLFLMIFITVVTAYDYAGGDSQNYSISGRGNFNNEITGVTSSLKSLNGDIVNSPMYSDVDNDGTVEIVILTDTQLQLFSFDGNNLDAISSISHSCSGNMSNLWIQDLDGDNYKEILFACPSSNTIRFYNLTDDTLYLQDTVGVAFNNNVKPQLGCNSTDTCFVAYPLLNYVNSANEYYISMFDITTNYYSGSVGSYWYSSCTPQISGLVLKDIDNDGLEEIILTRISYHTSNGMVALLEAYECVSGGCTGEWQSGKSISLSVSFPVASSSTCSLMNATNYAMIPLVGEFDSSVGLESIWAVQYSVSDFKIYSYDSTGSSIDDYPEVFDGEGRLISNPFVANVFDDTSNGQDFCALGYRNNSGTTELNLICASEYTSDIPETKSFEIDLGEDLGLDIDDVYSNEMQTHSVQMNNVLYNGIDPSEIATSWGIFELDYTGDDELELGYENPYNGVLMVGHFDGSGLNDIFTVDSGFLYYIDDGFVNSPAEILGSTTINPAYTSIWAVNTSVQVDLRVSDDDGDSICSKGFLYYGESFQQNSSEVCSVASQRLMSFVANTRVSNGILRLEANDTVNRELQVAEIPFTVDYQGISFGDAIATIYDYVPDTEEDEEETEYLTEDTTDNPINGFMAQYSTGTGFSVTTIILILMAVIGYFIIEVANENGWSGKHTTTVLGFIYTIIVIFSTLQGWLSTGVLISLVVLGITVIAIGLSKFFNREG